MHKFLFPSVIILCFFFIIPGWAQVLGEHPDLERLRQQAEDAMAYGDPDGAALNIGKAAMMASILAKQEIHHQGWTPYRALSLFFRSQENTYRAIAMFEKAGNRFPPPSSVCNSLQLGAHQALRAHEHLGNKQYTSQPTQSVGKLITVWLQTIQEMQEDFHCQAP